MINFQQFVFTYNALQKLKAGVKIKIQIKKEMFL